MHGVAVAFAMAVPVLGLAFWRPAAATDEASERPAPTSAPTTPPAYRRLIAVALLQQYRSDGDGPAEISQPRDVGIFRKTPQLIVRFRLNGAAARGMLLTLHDPPPQRYRCIAVEADPGFLAENPVLSFDHPRIDPPGLCAEHETFEPFVELQRMAGEVQPCRQRGDTGCAIVEAAGKEANGKEENGTVSPQ